MKKFVLAILVAVSVISTASAARIKDIATVQGARGNQLIGYGLVVGLAGTGDSASVGVTVQSVSTMLAKIGINVPQANLKLKNVAAVMVTAELHPFAKSGSTIDVVVSSLGDSTSLQGGTLLQTPLLAANNQTYAVAQGSVSVGGFSATGGSTAGGGSSSSSASGGSSVTQNHVTAGRIPQGAIVERDVPMTLSSAGSLSVALGQPDFTTASRVAEVINNNLPQGVVSAKAVDAGSIQVAFVPTADPIGIISQIEEMEVTPDNSAKIVINERTGTVVLSGDVTISPCAIAQGGLTVRISDDVNVSQPDPLASGTTVTTTKTNVTVTEDTKLDHLIAVKASPTIDRVVKALNALGVTPRDLISILQAMKQAGSLHAELEVQ